MAQAKSLDQATEWAKVLYYGIPGTGKTTNLAHLAKFGDVVYVHADRSLRRNALRRLDVATDRIYPLDELDPLKLEQTYCWEWAERLEAGDKFSIAIDTATELVARRIESLVDEEWEQVVEGAKAVDAELTRAQLKNRYFVNRDYYGIETQEMRRLFRHLRDLPCHVGIAAQRRRDTDESTGGVMYGPDTNPAIQGDLMAYSDFVIRLETDGQYPDGEEAYIGYTRPDKIHHGKDRDHVLPRILAQPTMDRVIAYITGDLTKDTDPVQARYRELVISRRKK